MICVSVAEASCAVLEKRLGEVASKADLIEIRLDTLADLPNLDIDRLVRERSRPLLFTNRVRDEGGHFRGSEPDRLDLLHRAVKAGADYVDLELRTGEALRASLLQAVRAAGSKLVLSSHDFVATPSSAALVATLRAQKTAGADVAKIVTTAQDHRDVQRLFSLYPVAEDLGLPLIAFCMGDAGRMSRLACLAFGAPWTYASSSAGRETAPGQIPLERLRALVDYFS